MEVVQLFPAADFYLCRAGNTFKYRPIDTNLAGVRLAQLDRAADVSGDIALEGGRSIDNQNDGQGYFRDAIWHSRGSAWCPDSIFSC